MTKKGSSAASTQSSPPATTSGPRRPDRLGVRHDAPAVEQVRAYAARWGVPVRRLRLVRKHRAWWYFRVRWFAFEVDTGDGTADVIVSGGGGVWSFEYKPTDPATFLLPLWAVHPHFTSVTMFWRMAPGQDYMGRWLAWYRSLASRERAAYKERFPAPTDEQRGWSGFYENVADVPARQAESASVRPVERAGSEQDSRT